MKRMRKDIVIVLCAAFAVVISITQILVLRGRVRNLQEELNQARTELAQVKNRALSEKLAATAGASRDARPAGELLKLRDEVTQLRKNAREIGPQEAALKAWAKQILDLKQAQERRPDKLIAELQLVSEKDWADAAWGMDLNTDDGVREALSKLRDRAVNAFFNEVLRPALKRYLQAHNGVLPSEISELKAYLGSDAPAFDEESFRRYRLLQTGQLSSDPSKPILELAVHVDPDYDSNHEMGINGASGGRYNRVQGAVEMAADMFANENQGRLPNSAAQLGPYLKENFEPPAIEKYLSRLAAERGK